MTSPFEAVKKLIQEQFSMLSILILNSKYVTIVTVDCDVAIAGLQQCQPFVCEIWFETNWYFQKLFVSRARSKKSHSFLPCIRLMGHGLELLQNWLKKVWILCYDQRSGCNLSVQFSISQSICQDKKILIYPPNRSFRMIAPSSAAVFHLTKRACEESFE